MCCSCTRCSKYHGIVQGNHDYIFTLSSEFELNVMLSDVKCYISFISL